MTFLLLLDNMLKMKICLSYLAFSKPEQSRQDTHIILKRKNEVVSALIKRTIEKRRKIEVKNETMMMYALDFRFTLAIIMMI